MAVDTAALARLPREDLVDIVEDQQLELVELGEKAQTPLVVESAASNVTAFGLGVADGSIGNGDGSLAKGLVAGASFATVLATKGEGPVGRGARSVFVAASNCLSYEAGKAVALKRRAEEAAKRQEEKAKAAAEKKA